MIDKVFLSLLPFLIIADVYIYYVFIKKHVEKKIIKILWFVPSIVLIIGGCFFLFSDIGSNYRGGFMIIYMAIIAPKVLFSVLSLFDFPFRYFFRWKVYPFTVVGILGAFAIFYVVLYGAIVGPTRFVVNNIEFRSPDVPKSFDGYRILQISDLHVGKWGGDTIPLTKMVELVNEQSADAVMITGDLVHTYAKELDGFEFLLSRIKAKDGVFSILGNHDYGFIRWKSKMSKAENLEDLKRRQANMGWHLLVNQHSFICKGNDSIAIIGVENEGMSPFPQYADLPKAMKGTGANTFKILMSHDPTHWRKEVLNTDVDLMLAGHTHGGQLGIGSISPASFLFDEWSGMYLKGKQGLYVNVGIGSVIIPFRFGVWPEITVITLKRGKG